MKPGGSETPYSTLTRENGDETERIDSTVKTGASEPQYFTLIREDNTETESNNNTPKYLGRNPHDTGVFSSVVDDSAIQTDTHIAESDDNQTIDDDSPYKGARF